MTTNGPDTMPTRGGNVASRGANQGFGRWLRRRRGLVIAGVIVAGLMALALNQHWLALASLTPLLFLLPCLAMMFMCMKGMSHSEKAGASEASDRSETPVGKLPRN